METIPGAFDQSKFKIKIKLNLLLSVELMRLSCPPQKASKADDSNASALTEHCVAFGANH